MQHTPRSLRHSVPVPRFSSLGQCYNPLQDEVQHLSHLWLLSFSRNILSLQIPLQCSNIAHPTKTTKIPLFLPSTSRPLPFAAFFPSSRPLLLLLLPTTSFSIHISGGHLWACVCICTIFSTEQTYIFFSSPPQPPPPLVNTDPARGFVLLIFF